MSGGPASLDLLVSIAHYNTPELLKRCLESLAREGSPLRKRVVVVDNASTPPLAAAEIASLGAELVSNRENLGFGRANNQAFAAHDAGAYLVTNPDVLVSPGSLGRLLARLNSDPGLGVVGPRLRFPDGRVQASCRRFPTLSGVLLRGFLPESRAARFASIRRYLMLDEDLSRPRPVDWMLGSCLMIKREALRRAGGFDPGFFMYYEDVDLCWRIARAGWRIEHVPEVEWVHDYRRESARWSRLGLKAAHFYSAMRFLAKKGVTRAEPAALSGAGA